LSEKQTWALTPRRNQMRRGSSWRALVERLLPYDPSQVVAYSRLALACLALAAVHIDPVQKSEISGFAFAVVAGYAVYALALAIACNFETIENKGPIVRHAFDICFCVALTLLTEGPVSPLFVFFTFAIVSGALHWGTRGAIGTAALLLGFYLAFGHSDLGAWTVTDFKRLFVLAPYLTIAGLLFGYVGAYRQRNRERLARLADWPAVEADTDDEPSLTALLRHAALVLGLDRVVIVWEDAAEPGWRVSHFNTRDGEAGRRHGGRIESKLVSDALANLAFMGTDPAGSDVLTSEGLRHVQAPLVAPGVFNLLQIRSFSCAPFEAGNFRGRVFILEPRTLNSELLSVTEIIAGRIGVALEHFGMRRELEQTAINRERARLARDLHDSILQELTAARLQLAGLAGAAPGDARLAIDHAANMLATQQRRIREFVVGANPKPARPTMPLAQAIGPILTELSGLWQCQVEGQFHPDKAVVATARLPQIRLILAEAVANAVRHGRATKIEVAIESDSGLWIEVRDNGSSGATAKGGRPTGQIAPFSLRQRVRDLGGGCNLTVGAEGGTLVIALPAA
jgi:signal transduction histidine kinase